MRTHSSYLVFTYQYREMPKAKLDAQRRVYHDKRDMDFMPATIIHWANVVADTKREAVKIGRHMLAHKESQP